MKFSNLRTGLPVALAIFVGSVCAALAQTPPKNGALLASALTAAEAGNWDDAVALARKNQDPIAVEIVEWHRLRAGEGSFGEYEAFLNANADWPGLPLLQKVSEEFIPEGLNPQRVTNYFATQNPKTGWGALRLAQAYQALGKQAEAGAEVVYAWREFSLNEEEQDALWNAFSKTLKPYNADRLDRLLWERKVTEARRRLWQIVTTRLSPTPTFRPQ